MRIPTGGNAVEEVWATPGWATAPPVPKGLRHGFGMQAVVSESPLNLVQKWLAHADIAAIAIHADVLGPAERAIAARKWRSGSDL